MDKNRIEGAAKELKGTIKEAAGKLTGNKKLEAEGKGEKIAGDVQGKVGKGADAVRDALK
ncbi:CsbD family protein [Agrobacterium bohemicum]|uniref:CsbD-like protein n=1 Tax=Agrobacterium bohemicum TaxID=2052828 RepID=A0A135P6F0_9HYPH|nr:CsbD family protein [Agrobacterium bohemicum]KXG86992.1 CsbD-like protein [Agrobacterium bohemicum]